MSDDTRPERDAAASLRRLLGNALSLLLAYVLPRILTIGAVILAARVLGAAGFGEYGTAAALAVLLSIVATLGMQPLLIREMARAPERAGSWMRAAHVVKLFSSALMLIALALAAGPGLGYPREVASAALILGAGCHARTGHAGRSRPRTINHGHARSSAFHQSCHWNARLNSSN